MMDPGNANAVTHTELFNAVSTSRHPTDNLMTWHHRQFQWGCATFDFVQLGVANAAGGHLYQNFVIFRNRLRHIHKRKGFFIFSDSGQPV